MNKHVCQVNMLDHNLNVISSTFTVLTIHQFLLGNAPSTLWKERQAEYRKCHRCFFRARKGAIHDSTTKLALRQAASEIITGTTAPQAAAWAETGRTWIAAEFCTETEKLDFATAAHSAGSRVEGTIEATECTAQSKLVIVHRVSFATHFDSVKAEVSRRRKEFSGSVRIVASGSRVD